jgi:RNA recognition motif-containing protein
MSTLRNNLVQDTLDAITNNSELRAILAKDGIVIEEVNFDREETVNDYMSLCGYSEEDAINAYNNLKEYE